MKGLDNLNFLRRNYCILKRERMYACDIIEKELKALEIIKEKEVDIKAFNDLQDLQDYNYYCSPELTHEEYNLLKEVLHENVSK